MAVVTAEERQAATSPWPRVLLAAAAAVWLAVFTDLLLTTGLPRVPLVDEGHLSTLGHLVGGFLMALQLALLLPDRRSPWVAAGAALAVTLLFVVGIEVIQELRPVRAYEFRDVAADVIGTLVGGAAGLAILLRPVRTRQRARLVTALGATGVAALGALVVAASEVVDRIPR